MPTSAGPTERLAIVYDGACPFCHRYARLLRLREALGPVALVDARQGGPLVDEIERRGLRLDDGMVLVIGDRYYHGADCIHRVALLGTQSDRFNRLNGWIFRSKRASRLLYPVLRLGRGAALRLLGRGKLADRPPPP